MDRVAHNVADYFLDRRIREGMGDRVAVITDESQLTYREIWELSNRYGALLRASGVEPEQRVLIALPDGPDFVAALFGTLKIGAVVVMVNPLLAADSVAYFYEYTRATVALVHRESAQAFGDAARSARHLKQTITVGGDDHAHTLTSLPPELDTFPSHRDDAAIWLFSGGTTGKPKAVVQSHRSFINTTECYAHQVIGYRDGDRTLSVPKLYFGYATGSNLLFPFSVGASCVLFPERCTADVLFDKIARHRPTILVNVPTMVNHMVRHPDAGAQDLSCLRLSTSAGEGLPIELHRQWNEQFGVELLDGLGTAEMWHIFLSNRPGQVVPGTLGVPVPGFDVRVRDSEGRDVPRGEVGALWVSGDSRAIGYWQQMDNTRTAFIGPWYASEDMVRQDADGNFVYCGRGDDMLKVGGKWLSPAEVESCLLQHPAVKEAAVVGAVDGAGLTKPHAFVVLKDGASASADELRRHVTDVLEPYKHPRQVTFMDDLPRTHLGKIDRGKLRVQPSPRAR